MCSQKHSDAAPPREEVACLDCSLTNIQHEMPSQGAGRILHHVQWQHPPLPVEEVRR